MVTYDDMLYSRARKAISEAEQAKMGHCIGFDVRKTYERSGQKYFRPYRNHFNPGGTDKDIWAGLKEKGFADCRVYENGEYNYWVTANGLSALSALEFVYIYSVNARGNEIDASYDVIEVLIEDAVYCGYGCWIPSSADDIAKRARLPKQLTVETLHYLEREKGYVAHVYEGGCDDEGFPHCTHGWVLTKKWKDEHKDRYEKAQKAEYARLDARLKEDKE